MGEWGIGQPVPRFEDPRLVRGEGRYVGDMMFPGTVPGYVLRSPHAHARIKSIDVSKAKTAPGVLAVLTGEDWDKSGFGDLPVPAGPKRRDGSPLYRPRYRALARDRVRWVGDYVAFVVAETVNQAMDAAELSKSTTSRCRPSFRPPMRSSPAPRWSGTIAPTTSASCIWKATRPPPTRPSRRPPMSSSITS